MVTRLLRDQAPDLADLHIRTSPSSGSSNWVFRIGEALAIRLPRSDDYVADLVNEVQWLPRLAPLLPAAVPAIVATGRPSETFPRPWAVVSWVPGDPPFALGESQQVRLVESLGRFLQALHAIGAADLPAGAERWGYRCGEPVTDTIDRWVEHAADELGTCSTLAVFARRGGAFATFRPPPRRPAGCTPTCQRRTSCRIRTGGCRE